MNRGKVDYIIAAAITFLLMGGLIMVFSASSMISNANFGSLTHFFRKQIMWGILAFVMMLLFSRFNYNKLKEHHLPAILVLISVGLLAGLFTFGTRVNGATRWYHLGIMNFQPSELTKIALIIYFAYFLSSGKKDVTKFKEGLMPLMLMLVANLVLIMMQPDLSTSLMIAIITFAMLFVSRVKLTHIAALALPVIPAIIYVLMNGYQMGRIKDWIGAWGNPFAANYQVKQSLIGLGRGGYFGQGLGQGKQKFLFLPDSHTDFIFSIIGEEFGFIGTTLVLLVFLFILFRGLYMVRKVSDPFGKFLALGITVNIVSYAFINAGVVSMLLPATGLPMPFISYGGSNLLFLGMSVGILLSISRQISPHGASANWSDLKTRREQLYSRVITVD
jgi:cell division protein FtsW